MASNEQKVHPDASIADFVAGHPLGNIHQTEKWGQFQAKSGLRDRFWAITSKTGHSQTHQAPPASVPHKPGQKAISSALIIRQRLPKGKCWLYCPRGPIADYTAPEPLSDLFSQIAALAKKENAVFFRFDPPITDVCMPPEGGFKGQPQAIPHAQKIINQAAAAAGLKIRPAHAHYQPESTLILDLTLSEDQLLAQMKPKGRYNIKVAQKHGIEIKRFDAVSTDSKQLSQHAESFYRLLQQTTSRDGFSGHPLKYYQDLLETLKPGHSLDPASSPSPDISSIPGISAKPGQSHSAAYLYLAYYKDPAPHAISAQPEGAHNHKEPTSPHAQPDPHNPNKSADPKPIAGIIVTHFKNTAIYYFGASGNEHRNTMAPYLLQWQAIRDAAAAGLKYYDFLGIAPPAASIAQGASSQTPPSASPNPPAQSHASPQTALPSQTPSEPNPSPAQLHATPEYAFDPRHPWAKVTEFKLKFGGTRVNYIPASEIVFQPFWYWLIRLIKSLKAILP